MFRSTLLTLGILIIITSLLFFGYTSFAQSPFIFGGFILNSFYCTCSHNFLLTLSVPSASQYVWRPGTPQFANYRLPSAGVWTLGQYTPGGVCLIWVGKGCSPYGHPVGTIGPIAGTSL